MSWRTVVLSKRVKVDFQMNQVTLRYPEETIKIHIKEIYMLIIETTAVSLTAVVLNELMKHKVKVIFCDEKHNPSSELVPYYGSHDSSAKYRRQLFWSEAAKEAVWTAIVRMKIENQKQLLKAYGCAEFKLLEAYLQEIEPGDATNREGHAAKVYFNAIMGQAFNRDLEIGVNHALNYGYSILLSAINREVVAKGYFTQLGLSHQNIFNHFNLSCDLMEPFRPFVDAKVFASQYTTFSPEDKKELICYFQEPIAFWGQKTHPYNAIRTYCQSVFRALENNDVSLIKFWHYEL